MIATLSDYIKHAREFDYMSGIERDNIRIKHTAEVFTPSEFVNEILDNLEIDNPDIFSDWTHSYMDNCCGDGQILVEVVIRKLQRSGCTLEQALSTIYGVELMQDNVDLCRQRLAGPSPTQEILDILNKNVVCADALKYDYTFGEPVGIEIYCQ